MFRFRVMKTLRVSSEHEREHRAEEKWPVVVSAQARGHNQGWRL